MGRPRLSSRVEAREKAEDIAIALSARAVQEGRRDTVLSLGLLFFQTIGALDQEVQRRDDLLAFGGGEIGGQLA